MFLFQFVFLINSCSRFSRLSVLTYFIAKPRYITYRYVLSWHKLLSSWCILGYLFSYLAHLLLLPSHGEVFVYIFLLHEKNEWMDVCRLR